jgi:uncharacterized protein YjiS (DUF1127 family)
MPIGQDFVIELTKTNDRRSAPVTSPTDGRFSAVILEMCLACPRLLARIMRMRRDRAQLHELPDHLLRDIGLNRSEIASITRFRSKDVSRRPRD